MATIFKRRALASIYVSCVTFATALCMSTVHAQERIANGALADLDLEALMQEPLIVTAQRRVQRLQDVPMSLSAYGEREIEAWGMKSIADVALVTPGMHFTRQNDYGGTAQNNLQIRGIQSRTGAPTTAVYIDDTPLLIRANTFNNAATLAFPQIVDLERVEILRGPQGTLFGASAEGGAVRFITNTPSLVEYFARTRAELSWTADADPSYEITAAAGTPLIEGTLGVRASAWYRKEGGWIDRCIPAVAEAGCSAVADHDANSVDAYGLRAALTWAPTDAIEITPSIFYQRFNYRDGSGYENAISDPASGKFAFALSSALPATDPLFIPSLKIDVHFTKMSLTSVTSYVNRQLDFDVDYTEYQDFAFFGNPYPLTGLPGDFARGLYQVVQNSLYQELRLTSAEPGARLNWVAGVYGERARQFNHAQVEHPNLPELILANYGESIEQVLGVPPYLGKWVYWADAPTEDTQFAAFASAGYKLRDDLELTVGARWARFHTDSRLFLAGPFNGGEQSFDGSTSSNAFTPKVSLSWEPGKHGIYYASAGKGFRSGGVNAQTTSEIPGCDVTAPRAFTPDSLWSYEIGAKNRFFDQRLQIDSSVFYVTWDDIQNYTQIPQCGIGVVLNAGKAISRGFDLSLQALLSSDFKVDLKIGYTDTYFKDSILLPGIGQIVTRGDAIAGASLVSGAAVPPWSVALSAEYNFRAFGRRAYVSLQDLFSSRNSGPFSTKNPANALVYDPSLETDPSVNLLNLRAGVRGGRGAEYTIFVNNLLNAHPQLSMNHALPGDPRYSSTTVRPLSVGVSATFKY